MTGVLALHRLDVRSASVFADGPTGVTVCRVAPGFGALPDWALVRRDLRRALDGELDLEAVRSPGRRRTPPARACRPPRRRRSCSDDASATATVLEVRAPDALGVLHRITAALARCCLDVRTAHISTLGADVVDACYLVGPDGGPLTEPALRHRACSEVQGALGAPSDRGTPADSARALPSTGPSPTS